MKSLLYPHMKTKGISIVLILFVFLVACDGGKKKKKKDPDTAIDTTKTEATTKKNAHPKLSREVLSDIVKSIPSPLEISFLIKDLGIQYDKKLLNSADNISSYNTNYKKALNLGIYSTDLGYANIYEQTQDALYYLNSVKEMADGLNIGQFFDFKTIKRLATKSNNLDSLLLETNTNLEKINDHLQEIGRADLTILILTGGWLESLYITCEIAKKSPNELLNNRIGEQKIILEQLLLLLSFYEELPNVKNLIVDLNKLQKIYENVKIDFQYNDPTTTTKKDDDNNEILIVDDNTSTKINFTAEDLNKILQTSKEIRGKIIN